MNYKDNVLGNNDNFNDYYKTIKKIDYLRCSGTDYITDIYPNEYKLFERNIKVKTSEKITVTEKTNKCLSIKVNFFKKTFLIIIFILLMSTLFSLIQYSKIEQITSFYFEETLFCLNIILSIYQLIKIIIGIITEKYGEVNNLIYGCEQVYNKIDFAIMNKNKWNNSIDDVKTFFSIEFKKEKKLNSYFNHITADFTKTMIEFKNLTNSYKKQNDTNSFLLLFIPIIISAFQFNTNKNLLPFIQNTSIIIGFILSIIILTFLNINIYIRDCKYLKYCYFGISKCVNKPYFDLKANRFSIKTKPNVGIDEYNDYYIKISDKLNKIVKNYHLMSTDLIFNKETSTFTFLTKNRQIIDELSKTNNYVNLINDEKELNK